MELTFRDIRQLVNDGLPCAACDLPAIYICGAMDIAGPVCQDHARGLHGGCGEHLVRVSDITVWLTTGVISTLRPDPELLRGARMRLKQDETLWRVVEIDMAHRWAEDWVVAIQEDSHDGKSRTIRYTELESNYEIVSTPLISKRFFDIAHSWMVTVTHKVVPLQGLYAKHKGPLSAKQYKDTMEILSTEGIDATMNKLVEIGKDLTWVPHVMTVVPSSRASQHTGEAGGAASEPTAASAAGGAAAATALSVGKMEERQTPFCFGAPQLGPFRFDNLYHVGAKVSNWREGSGIGVPEVFLGVPNGVSAFGIHAENFGCDFVNVLAAESSPTRWKFIPVTPGNTLAMQTLQTSLQQEHQVDFYKAPILADATLSGFGFRDFSEILQNPGDIVGGHSFHCGLGGCKIAEAHSWFSGRWALMLPEEATDTPVNFQKRPQGYTTELPTAKKVKGGKHR